MAEDKKFEWALPKGTILSGGTYPYEIVSCLGHGGFGITYKVKARVSLNNIKVDVFFALKEYFPTGCWRGDDSTTMFYSRALEDDINSGLSDFITEGNRLHKICKANPNIVKVNEVFRDNGTAYFVMEYLSGGDLREFVRQNGGGLSEASMLSILMPIASAIKSVHEAHILHLDIKPDNIVMRKGEDGAPDVPVLIDFGVAVHFNEAGEPTSTRPWKGVSQGYSPVEQYAGITSFDPRYDVYSLSATCYYMLTGHNPKSAFDVTEADIRCSLQDLASEKVVDAIVKGMSKEKAIRTSSAAELIADLTINGTLNIAQYEYNIRTLNRGSKVGNDSEKKPLAKNRKKWLFVVGGLVLLAIVGGIIWGSSLLKKNQNEIAVKDKNSGEVSLQDTVYSEALLKKAQDGDAQAQNLLGVCYYNGFGVTQDYSQAFNWFSKAAEHGLADAQCNLGMSYFYGNGVSPDYSQAVYWYRRAAEQGYAEAQFNLGVCYYNGQGVSQDYSQAIEWLRKSAEQHNAAAQNYLGKCYIWGHSVPQDYSQAVYWWRQAAEQGHAEAQYHLGSHYESGNGVTKDINQAVEWYRKAAEQGYVVAQNFLGECYEKGKGVPQDYSQAAYWWRKAAEQGFVIAQNNLGVCYEKGKGVPQDYSQAAYWWRKAAEQGYADAQNNLGGCYYDGKDVLQDYSQAAYWYRKAAEHGLAAAQFNLGLCFDYGKGVTKDINQAVEWYRKAAQQGNESAQNALKRLGYSW